MTCISLISPTRGALYVRQSLCLANASPDSGYMHSGRQWLTSKLVLHLSKRTFKKKWSKMNQRSELSRDVAVRCFEMELQPIFGPKIWSSVRLAIQSPPKYAAVLNDFSIDRTETEHNLRHRGAVNLLNHGTNTSTRKSMRGNGLPAGSEKVRNELNTDGVAPVNGEDEYGDTEYITATRLVGRDHELKDTLNALQSTDEYGFAVAGINIRQVSDNDMPDFQSTSWPKAYVFPWASVNTFGTPKSDGAGLLDFYPMDAASLLPVLALNVQRGDQVLDACSAPGGKAFAILQQGRASWLYVNDSSLGRMLRLKRMLKSYFPSPQHSTASALATTTDVTSVGQTRVVYNSEDITRNTWIQEFDRILIDVPCTTDRDSAVSDENNWYSTRRTSERRQLPDLQKRILQNALRALRVGGIGVYSTCSMSPLQNDGVVYEALQDAKRMHGIECEVLDVKPWMQHLSNIFRIYAVGGSDKPFGVTAFPHICSNFGPIYVCKLRRLS